MKHKVFQRPAASAPTSLWWAAAGLLLLAYLVNLGVHPLVLEEPRRAIVALEMLHNDNFWVPTFLGEYYYKKPPMYNWLLLLSAWFHGGPSEWAFRLPTVLSIAGIAGLLLLAGRRYHGLEMGGLSALLFAVSVDILFYFSILAEIDLFYAFVTFAGILAVFHFYQEEKFYALFASTYTLGAIGFLTKGLPSIPFTGLTITAYLLYKRQWRLLFSLPHLAGLLLFAGLIGAYYYQYSRYAPLPPLLAELFSESSDRTLLGNGLADFGKHLLLFPLDTLKVLLPASLLVIYLPAFRQLRPRLLQNEYVAFALLVFLVNYLLYWISPGSRQRYIYPLLPLAIVPLVYFFLEHRPGKKWQDKVLRGVTAGVIALLAAASLSVLWLSEATGRFPLAAGGVLFSGGLFYLWRRRPGRSLTLLILALAGARLLFSLLFLPLRAADEGDNYLRDSAAQLHRASGDDPLYLLGPGLPPKTAVYYFDVLHQQPLTRRPDLDRTGFYLVDRTAFDTLHREARLQLTFDDQSFWLIRTE